MTRARLVPEAAFVPAAMPGPRRQKLARVWPAAAGVLLLALLWLGPLPVRAEGSFAAHMVMHMGVVALAAPLLAIGVARLFPDGVGRLPPAVAIVASFAEFAAVWAWHAPALHDAARAQPTMFVLEQASFLSVGLLVWTSAIGAAGSSRPAARAAGIGALLVTSMHMTLLGGLLLFAPRPLYACAALCTPSAMLTPLADQQLGGAIMLAVGGSAYLTGGLVLLASILREPKPSVGGGA
jgi:putative membrane protein